MEKTNSKLNISLSSFHSTTVSPQGMMSSNVLPAHKPILVQNPNPHDPNISNQCSQDTEADVFVSKSMQHVGGENLSAKHKKTLRWFGGFVGTFNR